jgi:hypothetical protein
LFWLVNLYSLFVRLSFARNRRILCKLFRRISLPIASSFIQQHGQYWSSLATLDLQQWEISIQMSVLLPGSFLSEVHHFFPYSYVLTDTLRCTVQLNISAYRFLTVVYTGWQRSHLIIDVQPQPLVSCDLYATLHITDMVSSYDEISLLYKYVREIRVTLTYSMEQSPSWEANRFSSSQVILRILGNP